MGFKRKFNVGDKVVVKATNEVGKVKDYYEREYVVEFGDRLGWYRAEKLEKHTEGALFKVGDRVKYVSEEPYDGKSEIIGEFGTVVYTGEIDDVYVKRVGVEFDKDIDGHTCSGNGKVGHCWHVPVDRVEKVRKEYSTLGTDNSDPVEWEVGDKVVVVRSFEGVEIGTTGTVIEESDSAGVEFDKYIGAHSCGGRGKSGYCLWITGTYKNNVKRIAKKGEPVKLPELETGMKVKLHDGRIGFVIADANTLNYGKQKFVILLEGSFIIGDKYDSEGKHASGSSRDIDEVYGYMDGKGNIIVNGGSMDLKETLTMKKLWERSYEKKITKVQAEKELSEKHGVKVVIEG